MKLSDFHNVAALAKARDTLRYATIDALGGGLGVTLGGRYQDSDIVDLARGAVITELRRRIADIDDKLARHGVEVDEAMP